MTMVLQAFNTHTHARRFVSNVENQPPLKTNPAKAPVARVATSLSAAARRRRARTTGLVHTPRHAVERAKQHSIAKSKSISPPSSSSIRFDVPSAPSTIGDVEMKDAAAPRTASFTLPRVLARPACREVPREAVVAIQPDMKDTPMNFVRDALEDIGPAMMQVLTGVHATPVKNALPTELSVLINDLSFDMPSHMLAVHSRLPSAFNSPRQVTLYPIHHIVLAAHCASLPHLPHNPTPATPETAGSHITLPVVPLCIPHPETFPHLSAYLYTRRTSALIASLLPAGTPPPSLVISAPDFNTTLRQFSHKLAMTYTVHALLGHAVKINGLWRNVCALGVFDDGIWDALDVAWDAVVLALAIATGSEQLSELAGGDEQNMN